jgi:hypothetical protein
MATSARRIVSVATAISGLDTLAKTLHTQTLNPKPQFLVLTPSPSVSDVLFSPLMPPYAACACVLSSRIRMQCCVPGSSMRARASSAALTVTERLQVRVGRCRRAKRVPVLVRKLHVADEG